METGGQRLTSSIQLVTPEGIELDGKSPVFQIHTCKYSAQLFG
jgi:hypothetical protein